MIAEAMDFIRFEKEYGTKVLIQDLINITKKIAYNKNLGNILQFAKKTGLRFTFFFSTKNLKNKEKLIKNLLYDGHEISSHGHEHLLLGIKNKEKIRENFLMAKKEFERIKVNPPGFRPPYLSANKNVFDICKEFGFSYISCRGLSKTGLPKIVAHYIKNKSGIKDIHTIKKMQSRIINNTQISKSISQPSNNRVDKKHRRDKPDKRKYFNNRLLHLPVIFPYDWEAIYALGLNPEQISYLWKFQKGTYLFHPHILSKNMEITNLLLKTLPKEKKDYRIISNLKKGISISFDVY